MNTSSSVGVKAAAFAMTGVLCLFGCSGGGGSKSQSSSTLVTGAPPSSGLAPSTAPPSTAPPSPAPATPAPTVPGVYIVQKGDSLTSIAKQFGVTVAQLVAANNIKNQDHIEEGQRLTIPPTTVATATTRPGTTVAGKPGTTRATTTTTLHR